MNNKRYIGFSAEGKVLNSYTSSGGTFDTLTNAKKRSSAVEKGNIMVIEYELVPTGKKFIKVNGKWVELQDEQ